MLPQDPVGAMYDEFIDKKDTKVTPEEMMADVTKDDIRRINAATGD